MQYIDTNPDVGGLVNTMAMLTDSLAKSDAREHQYRMEAMQIADQNQARQMQYQATEHQYALELLDRESKRDQSLFDNYLKAQQFAAEKQQRDMQAQLMGMQLQDLQRQQQKRIEEADAKKAFAPVISAFARAGESADGLLRAFEEFDKNKAVFAYLSDADQANIKTAVDKAREHAKRTTIKGDSVSIEDLRTTALSGNSEAAANALASLMRAGVDGNAFLVRNGRGGDTAGLLQAANTIKNRYANASDDTLLAIKGADQEIAKSRATYVGLVNASMTAEQRSQLADAFPGKRLEDIDLADLRQYMTVSSPEKDAAIDAARMAFDSAKGTKAGYMVSVGAPNAASKVNAEYADKAELNQVLSVAALNVTSAGLMDDARAKAYVAAAAQVSGAYTKVLTGREYGITATEDLVELGSALKTLNSVTGSNIAVTDLVPESVVSASKSGVDLADVAGMDHDSAAARIRASFPNAAGFALVLAPDLTVEKATTNPSAITSNASAQQAAKVLSAAKSYAGLVPSSADSAYTPPEVVKVKGLSGYRAVVSEQAQRQAGELAYVIEHGGASRKEMQQRAFEPSAVSALRSAGEFAKQVWETPAGKLLAPVVAGPALGAVIPLSTYGLLFDNNDAQVAAQTFVQAQESAQRFADTKNMADKEMLDAALEKLNSTDTAKKVGTFGYVHVAPDSYFKQMVDTANPNSDANKQSWFKFLKVPYTGTGAPTAPAASAAPAIPAGEKRYASAAELQAAVNAGSVTPGSRAYVVGYPTPVAAPAKTN